MNHKTWSYMAFSYSILIIFFFFFLLLAATSSISLSTQPKSISLSFPLSSLPLPRHFAFRASLASLTAKPGTPIAHIPSYNYKSTFKYSMALIVSLPIGTPPQAQPMVLDTGSQLSWIQCRKKKDPRKPPCVSFNPSLSSSFSVLPCNHPICKPRVPDFSLPTSCDQNHLCHYSYFYADGSLAEGNLVKEKFTFSKTQSTPLLTLGCCQESSDTPGILGMNLGRLSFPSQAKITKFSYCVPERQNHSSTPPRGAFHLGQNPSSHTFHYMNLLTPTDSESRSPNFDKLAFTLPMTGIRIGTKRLNISAVIFRLDANGSGQTMIDSGSEFTYLVDEAYNKVRGEIVKLVGPKIKKGYLYEGTLDMCFDGNGIEIGRAIGNLVFEFEKGSEIVVPSDRVLGDVGGGVHCLGIGRSDLLGAASNIIGNVHQQNYWVEYDMTNKKVGLGKADCSKLVI